MIYPRDRDQRNNNEIAAKFQRALKEEPDAYLAINYLKSRGFTDEIIEKFSIGWWPSGVSIPGRDNLSGRIIFPIHDEYNNIVAFSGRLPLERDKIPSGVPHWLNEQYVKSYFLYGLNYAWKEILSKNYAIVVEGPCDVISCYLYGIKNAVGICSSSFTKEQIAKVARFSKKIVLMLDGDVAGQKGAIRAEKLIGKLRGFRVIRIDLSDEEKAYDPDSYLREFGKSKLLEKIKKIRDQNKQKKSEDMFFLSLGYKQ